MDTSVENDLKSDSQTTDTTKRRRYHTTDSATAERAIKLLARIKGKPTHFVATVARVMDEMYFKHWRCSQLFVSAKFGR